MYIYVYVPHVLYNLVRYFGLFHTLLCILALIFHMCQIELMVNAVNNFQLENRFDLSHNWVKKNCHPLITSEHKP